METYYARGHVEVTISYSGSSSSTVRLKADTDLARQYLSCMNELGSKLNLGTDIDLSLLFTNKDIIIPEDVDEDLDQIWDSGISHALREALANSRNMRANEGVNLRKEVIDRINSFSNEEDTNE